MACGEDKWYRESGESQRNAKISEESGVHGYRYTLEYENEEERAQRLHG